MKKTILWLLCAALLLSAASLCACGKKSDSAEATDPTSQMETASGAEATGGADETTSAPAGDAPSGNASDAGTTAAPARDETPAGETAAPQNNGETGKKTADGVVVASETVKSGVVFSVAADKTGALQTGDTVTLTARLSNAKLLACLDVELTFDSRYFTVSKAVKAKGSSLDSLVQNNDGVVSYAGYVMRTVNVEDEGLFTVTLEVKDGAGAAASFLGASVTQYLVGTDESGDATKDLTSEFSDLSFSIGKAG